MIGVNQTRASSDAVAVGYEAASDQNDGSKLLTAKDLEIAKLNQQIENMKVVAEKDQEILRLQQQVAQMEQREN